MDDVTVPAAKSVYIPAPNPALPTTYPLPILFERRSTPRYPIVMNARYRTLNERSNYGGVGTTVNMSSRGLLITSEQNIAVGVKLEVAIEWPALLDGEIELLLVIIGSVARTRRSSFALALSQYEFRTTKRKLYSDPSVNNRHSANAGIGVSDVSAISGGAATAGHER